MEYVFAFIGLALFGAVCHYLGMRRRRPEGETHGQTMQIMLSGPTTKPGIR